MIFTDQSDFGQEKCDSTPSTHLVIWDQSHDYVLRLMVVRLLSVLCINGVWLKANCEWLLAACFQPVTSLLYLKMDSFLSSDTLTGKWKTEPRTAYLGNDYNSCYRQTDRGGKEMLRNKSFFSRLIIINISFISMLLTPPKCYNAASPMTLYSPS